MSSCKEGLKTKKRQVGYYYSICATIAPRSNLTMQVVIVHGFHSKVKNDEFSLPAAYIVPFDFKKDSQQLPNQ